MSFSATYAGQTPRVIRAIETNGSFGYGGELGRLTQDYLTAVARLSPHPDCHLIVEASGHADSSGVSLNIRVGTSQALPPAEDPQEADVNADPAPDSPE